MTKHNFRNAYTRQSRKPFFPTGESRTQIHHQDEVKIQNIIKRYDKTGVLDHVARGVAHYGDYTKINEYQTYLDFVTSANESFAELPSNIREKFGNDAGQFFEFATDPKNKGAMEEMGLFPQPEISKEITESPESPPLGDKKSSNSEEKSE